MSGARFVEVPADRLLGRLREIGAAVAAKGGTFEEGVQGREVYVDVTPSGSAATVRIYTSLASGAAEARDCGEDAVRLVLLSGGRPLRASEKILRTAPRGASDRVGAFLERLVSRIRLAYADARQVPACDLCGKAMAERTRKADGGRFYGCSGFPTCRATRPIGGA